MAYVMPNKIENKVVLKRKIKEIQKKKIQISKLADCAKRAVWPALVYNLSNDPAFKFNLCVFGDKSNDIQARTSYFTKKQTIYLETETERYELCRKRENQDLQMLQVPQDTTKEQQYLYTFSRVLNSHDLDNEFFSLASTKVPLDIKYKEVIADDLDWQDLIWGDFALKVVQTVEEPAADGEARRKAEKTVSIIEPL